LAWIKDTKEAIVCQGNLDKIYGRKLSPSQAKSLISLWSSAFREEIIKTGVQERVNGIFLETLAKSSVQISEVSEGGRVPELKMINKSADNPISPPPLRGRIEVGGNWLGASRTG
jgi:hypothetical protein